jgi:hypothetical protein
MKLDQFATAVVIFTAIIAAGLLIVNDVNVNYADQNVSINTSSVKNLNKSSEKLYNYSNDMYSFISESETSVEALLKAAYSGLRLSVEPFKIAGKYMYAVAQELPIPPFLVSFLLAALAISFAFAVIYLVFRFIPFG